MKLSLKNRLMKEYGDKLPSFYDNLDEGEISEHPCFNCLYETEVMLNKGSWRKLSTPIRFWYEMCQAESKAISEFILKNKPKKVLEVGCGSGRIIRIILKTKYSKEIHAVDKDAKIIKIIKPLFKEHKNVHIINDSIEKFLKNTNQKFDLTLTMMNTLGNIDNIKTLKSIASHSKHVLFTVYDQKDYKLRKEIYLSKGHRDFSVKNKQYYFNDCWVKGLKSRSYTEKELKKMCEATGKKYEIKKISKLLFLIHLY